MVLRAGVVLVCGYDHEFLLWCYVRFVVWYLVVWLVIRLLGMIDGVFRGWWAVLVGLVGIVFG